VLERILHPAPRRPANPTWKAAMDILLISAIVLIVLALLGFTGVWAALRTVAWLLLVVAVAVLVISFLF
jgi:uncharacterized membrane protein YtjA (UPF0391 family)